MAVLGSTTVSGNLSVSGIVSSNSTTVAGNLTVGETTTLSGASSTSTKAIGDNSTSIATTAYVDRYRFPIGTIVAFDGTDWVDNSTLVGWYACVAGNAGGAPDLTNKFLIGYTSKGSTGGAGTVGLTTDNLPSHQHAISHSHSASSGDDNADHTHTIAEGQGSHSHGIATRSDIYGTTGNRNCAVAAAGTNAIGSNTLPAMVTEGRGTAYHQHTITVQGSDTANSGPIGSGSAFSIIPPYYTVIYIRRCT